MKVVLLHGPALISSRNKFLDLKKNFSENEIITFPKGSDPQEMLGAIQTPSFLSENQLIILENPTEDIQFPLTLDTSSISLILWFDHEIDDKKLILKSIKDLKAQILFFPLEKESSIFPFLDLLAEKNPKAYLELNKLQKTHEKFSDLQYLMTMIFYLLRSLSITPKNAPAFVKQKLDKQRKNFSSQQLKNLYKFTLETDFKIKSGLMDETQAQFMLVDKFVSV